MQLLNGIWKEMSYISAWNRAVSRHSDPVLKIDFFTPNRHKTRNGISEIMRPDFVIADLRNRYFFSQLLMR